MLATCSSSSCTIVSLQTSKRSRYSSTTVGLRWRFLRFFCDASIFFHLVAFLRIWGLCRAVNALELIGAIGVEGTLSTTDRDQHPNALSCCFGLFLDFFRRAQNGFTHIDVRGESGDKRSVLFKLHILWHFTVIASDLQILLL